MARAISSPPPPSESANFSEYFGGSENLPSIPPSVLKVDKDPTTAGAIDLANVLPQVAQTPDVASLPAAASSYTATNLAHVTFQGMAMARGPIYDQMEDVEPLWAVFKE